jgi:hypothetical protein
MIGGDYHCQEKEATNKRDSIQRVGYHLPFGRDALRRGLHHKRGFIE